ncbi:MULTISPECIES: YuzF family protein [Geobacillus]|jgi:hypothetical protein|uniref:YuzF n=2 Tax=Geobacillus thermodenitrificans TaxID=33940 RepID=A4ISN6_GEOTN|nr:MULTISPECIES: YuzF family protein [Geobacillus]ABO68340.1 YuzF [Geobacillus thermodenitrificans NG80-2]ARA98539.1 hypothetical protein GD3902_11135 [Geobacillus thermodenitrificans]ARP44051.1 hypothetical protein GTHT12_02551 [Geobacillus thermodenitrificans]ATO37922.1 hypothetical protein GTID1_12375 [Geobacillus thermodenitrificans]KQB91982.1 hypothetical protein GEPA3_3121 [Geobacillus sp. PA-3]
MNQPYASPQLVSLIDPYVYHALQSLLGQQVVVETTRNSLLGTLRDVKPDHLVLTAHQKVYYIRLAQVVSVHLGDVGKGGAYRGVSED